MSYTRANASAGRTLAEDPLAELRDDYRSTSRIAAAHPLLVPLGPDAEVERATRHAMSRVTQQIMVGATLFIPELVAVGLTSSALRDLLAITPPLPDEVYGSL
ncbi:hypothetical protein C7999DRAFT_35382 [Corynascus novoguineensis]|uniref:Uncharacterized protein n=1 Tax=Corynascus novoguineensis TaxID=1126955 RepID=A0AAN7CLE6_9PEZI|nr:hypothetical protein C7999DRAFT_35382 [Corynascus novoguineensis]